MDTVVVKSVDERAVRRAMDGWAEALLASRPEIEEIVVFGSFAEGTWAPGSDLDVLIRLHSADRSVRERISELMPARFPVPVDLFPFTTQELAERAGSPIVAAAQRSRWRYRHRDRS